MAHPDARRAMDAGGGLGTAPRNERAPSVRATSTIHRLRYSEHLDDSSYPTAYLVLPGDLKMPIAIAGDSLRLSSKIRASCKVHIECDGDDTAIRIVGKSPAHIQAAIRDINDAIRGLRTKEARGHRHLLVQPPSGPVCADGIVVLHPGRASEGGGTRPQFQPSGQDLEIPIPNFTLSAHEQRIVDLFQESMSTLQALGCNLKMRANFGLLKIQQQRRAPPEYDLRRFVAISDTLTNRAVTRLDTSLGPGANGTKIMGHFISSFSASAGKDSSLDLKFDTYHTLSLISSDRRIEATITHAADKGGEIRQRLANVEMFRRNWKRLDLISASPHMEHDWNLEVVVKEPVRPKPAWLDVLKKQVFLSSPSGGDAFSQNPTLRLGRIPELEGSVETTVLETSVSIQYPNTPYDITFSVTRTWLGTNTAASTDPFCTISIRGTNWDERMTSVGSWKQGNWEPELGMIFAQGQQSFREGFVEFVQCVIRSQIILDEMHPRGPARASVEGHKPS